jgi:hypothetical protein
MKSDVLLELLENTAEQLGVKLSYEPLAAAVGMGGLCRVKGQYRMIVDKRATTSERIALLAAALATFDTAALDLPAKVREAMHFHGGHGGHGGRAPRAA